MEHTRIIDDLVLLHRGQARLGRRLGVGGYDVCRWKSRGIPPRHWARLLEIAAAKRYPLTLAKLEKHSPLRRRRQPKPVNGA